MGYGDCEGKPVKVGDLVQLLPWDASKANPEKHGTKGRVKVERIEPLLVNSASAWFGKIGIIFGGGLCQWPLELIRLVDGEGKGPQQECRCSARQLLFSGHAKGCPLEHTN